MKSKSNIITAAKELAYRRENGIQQGLLEDHLRPINFQEAFDIQKCVGKYFEGVNSNEVAGWKCGMPVDDRLVLGPLYDSTIQYQSRNSVSFCDAFNNNLGNAQIEPEIAFKITKDFLPRIKPYTKQDIDFGIGEARLSLEIVRSRFEDISQANHNDLVADSMVNDGLWLGPEIYNTKPEEHQNLRLTIDLGNNHIQNKIAKHPAKNPKLPLYWLINFLSQKGIGVFKGQYIITGSYAGVLSIPVNKTVKLSIEELGGFSILFKPK